MRGRHARWERLRLALAAICLSTLASCGSRIGTGPLGSYDESAYAGLQSVSDGGYISFFADGAHIASFPYKGSAELGDYKGQESVLAPSRKTAYEFIDMRAGVLLVRERGSSGPTPVRIVDLAERRDLVKKGFFSVARRMQQSERGVILRKAGDRLNKDQEALLKMTPDEMERFATSAFKAGLAVEFYEKYEYDFEARRPTRMNEITPVLYPRNILY